MREDRLNAGLILKGDYNDLRAIITLIEEDPTVRIAFKTFSGDKLFIVPHRGRGE